MDVLLQVCDLAVNYRNGVGIDVPALAGVTFDIRAGEAVGLLGESGCGKTTIALALLRLLPRAGRIVRGTMRFRGRNLMELSGKELELIRGAEVSLIFQEPSIALNPVLCVGSQIAEVIHAHRPWGRRRCHAEAEGLLARVGLSDSASVYRAFPHELSGGQKQRILIAQALACGPSLIIADEPTTGLDTKTQAEILDLLKLLKMQSQTAFLFISHHPGVLARLADRLLIMYAGRIMEEGGLGQIYRNPLHPYTRGLLRSMPAVPAGDVEVQKRRLTPIAGSPPDIIDLPRGCPFAPRCLERLDVCADQQPPERIVEGTRRVLCHLGG